jgi:hypothetical protein
MWPKSGRRASPLEFPRQRATRMEQDNCRQRSESSGHTVTYRWLFITITLWRDMTMSDRRVFLATSGRHRQFYVEATHDEL